MPHNVLMEPQIRYVKSGDGTTLATATLGNGPPLVIVQGHGATSIEMYQAIPELRASLEELAGRFKVVLLDPRGEGLSERESDNFSLEARVADIAAVFDGLALGPAFLVGRNTAGPATISFTARHPELVSRLALLVPVARGRDLHYPPRLRILRQAYDVDYELACQINALLIWGWTDAGRLYGSLVPRSISRDVMVLAAKQFRDQDVWDVLPAIRCPTLVIGTRTEESRVPLDVTRRIAAEISGARFRMVEGAYLQSVLLGGPSSANQAVIDFFEEEVGAAGNARLPEGTTVILFADIADSTALTEGMGDSRFRTKARALDETMRRLIRERGGSVVDAKTLGDGVLATFPAASQAIGAALACGGSGDEQGLSLHLGLHAGDVIREENNVFGGAVNIASRISSLSAPGEVLVSDIVRGLARTSAGVTFEDRGEQVLKGIADPVRVFAARAAAGRSG